LLAAGQMWTRFREKSGNAVFTFFTANCTRFNLYFCGGFHRAGRVRGQNQIGTGFFTACPVFVVDLS
jgi:hypothetical protein